MDFRYHPVLEALQVNEDGSEILMNGERLVIKEYKPKHTRITVKLVDIGRKKVTTTRLVLEAWQGMPENLDCAARRHDESAGDHYTNLYWGKKGMTKSAVIGHKGIAGQLKITHDDLDKIEARRNAGELLKNILQDYNASEMAYHRAKKRYAKKNKK